jgi:hypothetical protein
MNPHWLSTRTSTWRPSPLRNPQPIHGGVDPHLGEPLWLEIVGRPRRILSRLEYFNVHDGRSGPVLACAWLCELTGGERWWVYRDLVRSSVWLGERVSFPLVAVARK